MRTQDYYSTLCIDRNASPNEIKSAYRRLAHRFHPDVSDDPDGESKFKAIAEAYRTLKQPASRAAYDHRALPAFESNDLAWFASPLLVWCAIFQWHGLNWLWPR